MSNAAIDNVRQLEAELLKLPQVEIEMQHILHAGMYVRSAVIPAGVCIAGVLIKIATILIISGDVIIYVDGEAKQLHGYNVFAASANRKQSFVAQTDTCLTMIFPSHAKSVAEAEAEFTDDGETLASRRDNRNTTIITGE